MRKKRLGEALIERQSISADHLEQTLEDQRKQSIFLGELLLKRNLVPKEELVAAIEEVSGVPYVDPRFVRVEKSLLEVVPRPLATRFSVLPLSREGKGIVVLMAEPQNLRLIDELRFLTGSEVYPRFGFRSEIADAIEATYPQAAVETAEKKFPKLLEELDLSKMKFVTIDSSERQKAAMKEFQAELRKEKTPAVRLVSAILASAAEKKASDIHIEPQALSTVVRIRVDGILQELGQIPNELQTSLVSRVKILADMDIAERRAPQDGRFLVQNGERSLDFRVSTLPSQYGEKIVMRVLDPSATQVNFLDLGFSEAGARGLTNLLSQPQGMVLITGPTSSGKTTTLYAAMNTIRKPTINIITVEDPVEYKLEGITQVQVNMRAGRTFANCLRSILRQDPNVIMVGEIRDGETAEIAMQSSQTGHLVLSTLHTNDSVAAITRLLDLNIPPFMVVSSVSGIIAQRLVRKLCTCRREEAMTVEYAVQLEAAGIPVAGLKRFVAVGCRACDYTGYKGRTGVYEMLVFDDQIRKAIRDGERDETLRMRARSAGMRLMQEDGQEKVKVGLTTLEEVLRVVPFESALALRCPSCGKTLATAFAFCPYCGAQTFHSPAASGTPKVSNPTAAGVAKP